MYIFSLCLSLSEGSGSASARCLGLRRLLIVRQPEKTRHLTPRDQTLTQSSWPEPASLQHPCCTLGVCATPRPIIYKHLLLGSGRALRVCNVVLHLLNASKYEPGINMCVLAPFPPPAGVIRNLVNFTNISGQNILFFFYESASQARFFRSAWLEK